MAIMCEVTVIDRVEKHPDADTLDIVYFGEFKTISRLGQFKVGDYGIYLATACVLPEQLLRDLNMWDEQNKCGRLAGSKGDRIKPRKLRGIVSEGIMHGPYTLTHLQQMTGLEDPVGAEVKDLLGVTKYDPNVFDAKTGKRLGGGDPIYCFTAKALDLHKYDIENIKKHSKALENYFEESQVLCSIKEKGHGCFSAYKFIDNDSRPEDLQYRSDLVPDNLLVSSKGRLERGNFLKPTGDSLITVWWQVAKALDLVNRCADVRQRYGDDVTILGEILGVQDLTYGAKTVENIKDFNYRVDQLPEDVPFLVFDVYVGSYGNGRYLDHDELDAFCERYKLRQVPCFYVGPYSREIVQQFTNGKETISGKALHIREGVVVRAVKEGVGHCRGLGRVQVKSISDAYLLRANGTEFT